MKLTSSLRSVTLPHYANNGYQKILKPNFAQNYTLNGKMYVDFLNNRGGHKITFDIITAAEYSALRSIWQDQFDNEEFLTYDPENGDSTESVFLKLPAESNIVWNQQMVKGLQIILEPEDAIS